MDEPRIKYEYPIFPDQTYPNGNLLSDLGCQACWYYYVLAHKAYVKIGEGQFGLIEGNPWLSKQYVQIARTVATLYGLKDPSEFMKYFPLVAMECSRLKMSQPVPEYMKPLAIAASF